MAVSRSSAARAAVDRSFEELYRGHRADVFRAALRELGNVHDAEDVTQAAFVDAYRAVLRGSKPQSPRAWLLAIAENVRRRRYRTALRRPREEHTDADFPLTAELPHEHARTLAEALAELPQEQRRVFVLREIAGLSYDEIAHETESTVGAVQMQLFRARRSLRERLDPPTVSRRRTGLLPLPGWLTTLFSRPDVTLLTPRAAGAIGAAAVAVATSTVAVNEAPSLPPPAEQPPSAVVAAGAAPVAAAASPGRASASRTARPTARVAVRVTARADRPAPVRKSPTARAAAPTSTQTATPTPAPASVPWPWPRTRSSRRGRGSRRRRRRSPPPSRR